MKNLSIPIFLSFLCTSFIPMPHTENSKHQQAVGIVCGADVTDEASSLFAAIELDHSGLSREAFDYAWKGYQQLLKENKIGRTDYLTICDFSQSSRQKRLYIIDIANNKLLLHTYVAHGRNSGGEYATKFSNTPESLQSSLGFYVTSGTYIGGHGLSLHMNGVDPGFNDNALMRSIVIHGAAYVTPSRSKAGAFMGRSYGCPAVPQKESAKIINSIKNGTCLFIYHPDKNYLHGSKILNG